MHGNATRVTYYFVILVYERCSKVNKYVDDKHHIHNVIHYNKRVRVHADGGTRIFARFRVSVELLSQLVPCQDEGSHVWRHDRSVDDKKQD